MRKTIVLMVAVTALSATLSQAQRRNDTKPSPKAKNGHSISKKHKGPERGHKFNFSLGVSLAVSNTVTNNYQDAGGTATVKRNAAGFGVFAYPKYHFFSGDNFSLSVGIPLTVAFSSSSNSRTGTDEGSTSFLYDLPLMIDYNGGAMCPAHRYDGSRLGYFAGIGIGIENTDAGYDYVSTGYTGTTGDYTKAKSVGPNIEGGVVLRYGREDRPHFVGVRLSYKIGLNKDKFNYFTPSVFLNF